MAYGIEKWGVASWGGADFVVLNQSPADNALNISRTPTISFTLSSQSGSITLSSINLTVNSISLISSGVFTTSATGNIDSSDPNNVKITANVIHAFAPLQVVVVNVSATNSVGEILSSGNSWKFTVNNSIHTFMNYISKGFQRINNIGATGLTTPQNAAAEVNNLAAPTNFTATVS